MSKKRGCLIHLFLMVFAFLYSKSTLAQTINNVPIESTSHLLPQVSIEHYKNELLEFQKLQRENEKLKLEEKNLLLRKKLSSLGDPLGIEATKVISIFTSKGNKHRLSAQIYNPTEGVKIVEVGSLVLQKYEVEKITPTFISLRSMNSQKSEGRSIILSLIAPGMKNTN